MPPYLPNRGLIIDDWCHLQTPMGYVNASFMSLVFVAIAAVDPPHHPTMQSIASSFGGFGEGKLCVEPFLILQQPVTRDPGRVADLRFELPYDPSLIGWRGYVQALELFQAINPTSPPLLTGGTTLTSRVGW